MSVRVVEADDALSPALFGDRAQPVDAGKSFQSLQKTVEVGFLKTYLHIVRPLRNPLLRQADQPAERLLQCQTARKGYVDAVILPYFQAEQLFVEFPCGGDIRYCKHRADGCHKRAFYRRLKIRNSPTGRRPVGEFRL